MRIKQAGRDEIHNIGTLAQAMSRTVEHCGNETLLRSAVLIQKLLL